MANGGLSGSLTNTLDPEFMKLSSILGSSDEQVRQLIGVLEGHAQQAQAGVAPLQVQHQAALNAPIQDVDPQKQALAQLVAGISDVLTRGKDGKQLADSLINQRRAEMLTKRQERIDASRAAFTDQLAYARKIGDTALQLKTLKEIERLEKTEDLVFQEGSALLKQQRADAAALERVERAGQLDKEAAAIRAGAADKETKKAVAVGLMTDSAFEQTKTQLMTNLTNQQLRRKGITKDDALNRLPQMRELNLRVLRSEIDKPAATIRRIINHNRFLSEIKTPRQGGVFSFGKEAVPVGFIGPQEVVDILESFYASGEVPPERAAAAKRLFEALDAQYMELTGAPSFLKQAPVDPLIER